MARETSLPLSQAIEPTKQSLKSAPFVRSQLIALPSPNVKPQLIPPTPVQSPSKPADEEALRRLFAHVGTLQDLPGDPHRWTPSQLALYLTHVLGLTAHRLVSDLIECITHKRLTGHRFLCLTEKDLHEQLGFSVAWASMLAAARQRLRADCIRDRLSDCIEEEAEEESIELLETASRNNVSWRSSWRQSSGLKSPGHVTGMTALFETVIDSDSSDSEDSVSDNGEARVHAGRWSDAQRIGLAGIELSPEEICRFEGEESIDPFIVQATRCSTASSYHTAYEETSLARDFSFDRVRPAVTPPTSEDSRLDSLFQVPINVEPLRSVTETRIIASRSELADLHRRLDEMQQSIEVLKEKVSPSKNANKSSGWIEVDVTVALFSFSLGVLMAATMAKVWRR